MQIPTDGVLSREDFKKFMGFIGKTLDKRGVKYKQIKPYSLEITMPDKETRRLGIQNLERKINRIKRAKWQPVIDNFFNILLRDVDYEEIAKKDPVSFSNSLRIKLHPVDDEKSFWGNSIYEEYLPNIRGVVSMDSSDVVVSVSKSIVEGIGLKADKVLKKALENTLKKSKWSDKVSPMDNSRIEIFAGDDYAATSVIEMSNKWSDLQFGKVFAIPSKHIVTTLTVTDSIIEDLKGFISMVLNMFSTEVGPISKDLYWYWKGDYYLLDVNVEKGKILFEPDEAFMANVVDTIGSI